MSKCMMCGSKVEVVNEPLFHYTDCGLNKVYLRDIPILKCSNSECADEEIAIPNIEELHQTLSTMVAMQKSKLQPEEIRFLRTHLGFSGIDFAQAMGVSPETVSRWEKGSVKMKEASERLLRVLILGQLGPFRDYEQLKSFATKESRSAKRYVFKLVKKAWCYEAA